MRIKGDKQQLLSNLKLPSILAFAIIISLSLYSIVSAHGGDVSLIHACIGDVNGRTTIVGVNDTCGTNETALDWIKNIFTGQGLDINRASDGATLSLADNGVTSGKIANGSVTTAKIADGAVTQTKLADSLVPLASIQAYQVNPVDGQTTNSNSFVDMTGGTQQIMLSQKSMVQVNAHANAFSSSSAYAAYIRVTYDSGGADTEIGAQGYTNAISDGQSISAGGIVTLNAGTYTIAMQKKTYLNPGGSSTFYQPSMSIVVIPTQ